MPELPEVEICARNLRRWLVGERILSARAEAGSPLRGVTPEALRDALEGRVVDDVCRRGKQLWLPLDNGAALLAHLGMTGKFILQTDGDPTRSGARLVLGLKGGRRVVFVDPRRIGRIKLSPAGDPRPPAEISKLGEDALTLCPRPGALWRALQETRRAVKVALLDQHLVAGIGNIYACEGLWGASVPPTVSCRALSVEQADAIGRCVVASMERSLIRDMGPEIIYVQDKGGANPFTVYGRAGEPCPRCERPIERLPQGGRSTFWCPGCQR